MKVLGIWDGHDASAALVCDGEIVLALGEERLSRRKMQRGFPALAVAALLTEAGIAPDKLDAVAVAGCHGRAPLRLMDPLFARRGPGRGPQGLPQRLYRHYENLTAGRGHWRAFEGGLSSIALRQRLKEQGIPSRIPLYLVDHHAAHSFGAASMLPQGTGVVWTMDGYGDGQWASCSRWQAGHGELIRRLGYCDSPAVTYGAVSQLLGYAEGEEGKLTALAAHGDAKALTDFFLRGPIGRGGPLSPAAQLLLQRYRPEEVAAGVQSALEQRVLALMEASFDQSHSALSLAGGLFANVALNGRLASRFSPTPVFVFPAMGDGGLSLGAALYAHQRRTGRLAGFRGATLGPNPDLRRRSLVVSDRLRPLSLHNPERRVAHILAGGGVVAIVQGPDEFGPRALGNRSLLFSASNPALADTVQERLQRNRIMPFAPICRNCNIESLFEPPYPAPDRADFGLGFMTFAVKARAETQRRYPVAVHVDGTARVQSLGGRQQRTVYRILTEYERLTGEQLLINTSFNRHGEPIVSSQQDAVETFLATGLDALLLGRSLHLPRSEK
jgi:carbamoyltransferase